jgi:hypothetical protein
MMTKAWYIIFPFMMLIASAPFLLPEILVVQRAIIAYEMTERMENEELQEITIECHKVRWVRQGKEIWAGNRLFDVKETRTDGSRLILKGLYDDREKEIISKMDSLFTPLPFEKERSSVIYQLTHLETALLPAIEEVNFHRQSMNFPILIPVLLAPVKDPYYTPPEMA